MLTQEVKKLSPIDRLVYWITEREAIRKAKEAGKPLPYTDDVILQNYRFCNVRRIDDKVSQWLLQHWYLPNKDHHNMLIAVALARFFNKPETLDAIGFPFNWEPTKVKRILRKLQKQQPIFNGAYMVRGNDGNDKVSCVIDYTINYLEQEAVQKYCISNTTNSMEQSTEIIKGVYGMGSFMAGQIVADLRWALTGTWRDKKKWAAIGPGSRRGMNILMGREINYPLQQEQFLAELQRLMEQLEEILPKPIIKRLEAIDYQNCCCEMSKYHKALQGIGNPKQRYAGT